MSSILGLYPGWWRERYGDEVADLLGSVPRRPGDRADLLRGAADAWLHPPVPSRVPGLSALIGGGLWTAIAAGVVAQPVPPDWPGYLVEMLGVALVSVAFLLVALLGIAVRGFDAAGRPMCVLAWVAIATYLAWMVALVGAMTATVDGPSLAASQALAMIATAAIGVALLHLGDEPIGALVLLAGVTMLIPWTEMWLAFGAVWTAIGAGPRHRAPTPGEAGSSSRMRPRGIAERPSIRLVAAAALVVTVVTACNGAVAAGPQIPQVASVARPVVERTLTAHGIELKPAALTAPAGSAHA